MKALEQLFDILHESVYTSSAEEIKYACRVIIDTQAMNSGERDCIRAAFLQGPLFDGDVPSKTDRDTLISKGYMVKVVVAGEEGFNACTYKGAMAYRLLEGGCLVS